MPTTTEGPAVLRLRRHRAPEQPEFLDLGDGKSPERRRADARRAHYEHQRRLLEVKDIEQLISTLQLDKSAP
jgi:hypothetical protein